MEKFSVTVEGFEQVEKKVIRVGNGAGVLVPKRWLNGKVHCILIEEPEEVISGNDE